MSTGDLETNQVKRLCQLPFKIIEVALPGLTLHLSSAIMPHGLATASSSHVRVKTRGDVDTIS